MQNCVKYSFVSNLWTSHFRPSYFRKEIFMDVIKIDWGQVFVILNGAIIQLPISVKIPIRDKYRLRYLMRKRSLLLHVMLRQGTSWYALDNIEYLLLLPCLEESEI